MAAGVFTFTDPLEMTADCIYAAPADPVESVQALLDRRSDILDFEFLCGFNHWLLGYVMDDIRGRTFPSGQRFGWPDQAAETLEQVCALATSLRSPFSQEDVCRCVGSFSREAHAIPGSYAFRATTFCLRQALKELNGPDRRWAHGKADELLAVDACDKRALLSALTEEVFTGLREMAASFKSDDVNQFALSMKAAEVSCQAALTVLWGIDSYKSLYHGGLEALSATLDEEVDSEAVQKGGRLAEQLMHRVWMRLHDEITAIERRHRIAAG